LADFQEQWIVDRYKKMFNSDTKDSLRIALSCLKKMSELYPDLDFNGVQDNLWTLIRGKSQVMDTTIIGFLIETDADFLTNYKKYVSTLNKDEKIDQLNYLVHLKNKKAGEIIQYFQRDNSPEVINHAILCLGIIKYEPAIDNLLSILGSATGKRLVMTVRSLGYMKKPRLLKPLASKLKSLKPSEIEVRKSILFVLNGYHNHDKIVSIMPSLKHANKWIRLYALYALTNCCIEDSRVLKEIASLLNDKYAMVREMAVFVLGQQENPVMHQSILKSLSDPEPSIRRMAIAVLPRFGEVNAAEKLNKHAHDPSPEIRMEVARTLGTLGSEKDLELLAEMVKDPDEKVRLAIAESLKESSISIEKKQDIFIAMSSDKSAEVRLIVFKLLRHLRSPEVERIMKKARKDPAPLIKTFAHTYFSRRKIK